MNLIWRRIVVIAFVLMTVPVFIAAVVRLQTELADPLAMSWIGFALLLMSSVLIGFDASRRVLVVMGAATGIALAGSMWKAAPLALALLSMSGVLLAIVATTADYLTRKRGPGASLHDFYQAAVKARRVRASPAQLAVVARLDKLMQGFARYESRRHLPWNGFSKAPEGVYLHGPAGRGKSFLLDGMFELSPSTVKHRFHFHELMSALNARVNAVPPLAFNKAVKSIAPRASLIVIDEVNVLDVGSAVLFSRLMSSLWSRGCVVCISSNQNPESLFVDMSTVPQEVENLINRLDERMQIMALTDGEDYRLQKLSAQDLYQYPIHEGTTTRLENIVRLLAEDEIVHSPVTIGSREVNCHLRSSGIAWFTFEGLCGGAHSFEDYLALVEAYPNLVVSGVPRIDDEDQARRFAWLVEIIYDAKKRLIISAHVSRDDLFANSLSNKGLDIDYVKILSRLAEMQSSEYNYSLA